MNHQRSPLLPARLVGPFRLLCAIVLWVLVFALVPSSPFAPRSAFAAACPVGAVTVIDNVMGIDSTTPFTFYEDTGITPQLRGIYAGYTIKNNAATTSADVWVKLDTFSNARIGLATNEDGVQHIGPLAPGASKQVYFFIADATGSGSVAALNETFQVNVYNGDPSLTSEVCDYTETINSIDDNIQAAANKIITSVSGPNPATIGGIMTMSTIGESGTVGTAKQFAASPATYINWPANAYQLVDSHIDWWQGTTCPAAGGVPPIAPSNTYDDKLVITTAGTTNSCYRVLYTFVATGATAAPTSVSPINNISSGTQIKHTSTSGLAALAPIQPATNSTTLSKSVSPTTLPVGGTASYTVLIKNASASTVTLDSLKDVLPTGAAYVNNSSASTCTATPVGNPIVSGQTLNWTGLFVIPTGATGCTLTYQTTIPNTAGSYTNSVTGKISATQIDTTITTSDNAPATATVGVGSADLSLTKTGSPGTVVTSDQISYSLTATNAGNAAASNIQVVDTLPAGVTFVSATGTGWTCNNVSGTVTCTLPTLAVATSAPVITIVVTAPVTAGSIINSATVSSPLFDPDASNNTATATTTVNAGSADLSINKTASPDPVVAGAQLTYSLAVSNAGPNNATSVQVVDTLPAGVTFVSATGTGWTCNNAAGTVTCTVATLVPGAAPAISIVVTAPAAGGSLSNSASVSSVTNDPSPGNNSSTASTTVTASADLSLVKTALPSPVVAGGQLTYNLAVTNNGPSAATTVEVVDTLPAGVTFVSATGTGWTCNNAAGTVTCTVATLATGVAPAISIVVTAPTAGGSLSNSASVSTTTSDPNPGNNSSTASTTVTASADLSLIKTASPSPVVAGGQLTYNLAVTNNGPSAATSVQVADTLPAGVTFVSATGTGWTCNNVAGTVTCTVATLATGVAPTISIVVTAPAAGGSLSNTATVSSATSDPSPGNNSSTVATNVTASADLSLIKTASANPVEIGKPLTYSLAVTNNGPSTATSVQVVDTLPAGVTFVSATGTGWTCNNAAGTVTCTRTTLVVGASPVIAIAVIAPAASGLIANSAIASSATNDPNPANNTGNVSTNIIVLPGTVSGNVFSDLNGNGTQNTGENGLVGVTIGLYDANGVLVGATVQTDGTGNYTFSNVLPGSYTVRETDPGGYISTTSNSVPVNVTSNSTTIVTFGDQQVGSISGTVYNDINGNGVQDAGETGITGVTVTIKNSGGTTVGTLVTDVNGAFTLAGQPAGSYTLVETDLSGYVSTTTNSVVVSVAPGGAATASFGDQQQGSVSGVVYSDANGNGVQDTGESGIAGVTIRLVNSSGVAVTTTTLGDGSYTFSGVTPGNYTVEEIDPNGYVSTTSNAVPIVLTSGGAGSASFGDQQQGTVSGTVYLDLNGDGTQDSGEAGIAGVVVKLVTSTGTIVAFTTTDSNGAYSFSGVSAGNYTVQETDASGYVSSTANTVPVSLAAGGAASANFGDQQVGTISGTVFSDLNGDGAQNSESGLGGVTVKLIDANGNIVQTTTTLGNGSYSFVNVTPGSYTIQETDPSGYVSTTPNSVPVVLANNGALSVNFGDQPQGVVSGVVFVDLNGDGTQGSGENGIGGVTVKLVDSNGTIVATQTTVGTGSYIFTNVPAGSYTIQETDLPGYISTTSNTVPVNVTAGASDSANFGDRPVTTVSGVVFNDTNGDGTQGPGENGIGGVVITLYDQNGTIVGTATTAGNGTYVIPGVVPGIYTLTETDPAGYLSTTPNSLPIVIPPNGPVSSNFGDQMVGSISGQVYNDLDGSGTQGSGESGLGGVTITLLDSNNNPVATTTTAGDGSYSFTNVPVGSYTVQEAVPTGYRPTTSSSVAVTLGASGAASASFGDQLLNIISGTVFTDLNGDGVQDPGEAGIGGVIITLTDGNGNQTTVTTTADGTYLFTGLPPGNYTITQATPGGYNATTPTSLPVTLPAVGPVNTGFGNQQFGTVSGTFFDDTNGNAAQSNSEGGLGSVTVNLVNSSGTVVATTTTAADGSYIFANVPPGSYTVVTTTPANYAATTPITTPVVVGSSSATANFGATATGTLAGTIFQDADGDGIQDPNEQGMANVTITITDSQGVVHTVITDANGSYSLPLPIGAASFSIDPNTLPNGVTLTTSNAQQTVPISFAALAGSNPVGYTTPTAVTLRSFTATWQENGVRVRWETSAEYGTLGFDVYRSSDGTRASATRLTPQSIPARGTGAVYTWLDTTARAGVAYSYWLQETEVGGVNTYGPVAAAIQVAATNTRLYLPLASR